MYVIDVLGIFLLPISLAEYYNACNSLGYGTVTNIAHADATMCTVSVDMQSWGANVTVPCYTVDSASVGQPAQIHYNMRDPSICTQIVVDDPPYATYKDSVFVINTVLSAWWITLCLVAGFLYYERRRSMTVRDLNA